MARRGELFPDETRPAHGATPGTIDDDEELERRVAGSGALDEVPTVAFTRSQLTWNGSNGGASVHRTNFVQAAVGGRRGRRGTIKARTGDIRAQADDSGNREWHVVPSPQEDDISHAEIYRDPRGKRPSGRDREDFLAVWNTVAQELRLCKGQMPDGQAKVSANEDGGVRLLWEARSGQTRPVGQVESIREAIGALVRADIILPSDAKAERERLESDWTNGLEDASLQVTPSDRRC